MDLDNPSFSLSQSAGNEAPTLESLPEELLQLIFSSLVASDLRNLALVSKCLYQHAVNPLWRNVCLKDCWKLHSKNQVWTERGVGDSDEHDDTPIIQKLYILAQNPFLAAKVQILTHSCHLPTPSIFQGLPRMYFHGENLSQDPRVHHLLQLAIRNLVNVHTLRIIYGHWHITRLLLEGFLDPDRPRNIPIRKLWLESCSVMGMHFDPRTPSTLSSLESLRIRRLRVESDENIESCVPGSGEIRLARGGHPIPLHNGAGGFVSSTIEFNRMFRPTHIQIPTLGEMNEKAAEFDVLIWKALPEVEEYILENPIQPKPIPSLRATMPLLHLIQISASTLTSLNLDWVLWRKLDAKNSHDLANSTIQALARMRFPHLRAFQLRNAIVRPTQLPDDVYLLESTFLEFLEAHPKIKCLAWPMDRFYSHMRPSQDVIARSRKIVAHFGMVLVDLRVDSSYISGGERFTDDSTAHSKVHERIRRRRFINEFAPYMTKLEQIKLEGGIPRDEKREVMRALHFCPLKKIVLIGVSFPIGNTWGHRGEALKAIDETETDSNDSLEEEDVQSILATCSTTPRWLKDFHFSPSYGWPPSPPFLHTIALHHASTITELKLCGYNGSPVLSRKTPITDPLLTPLRHFHNLEQLVISLWLLTSFEGQFRDKEIIESWLDTRSPSSTALVVVTPPTTPSPPLPYTPTTAPGYPSPAARPQTYNRWAVALKTQFTPSALAYRVARDIGPHLSPFAKQRKGGVRVRASFCLGVERANDIFDLDIKIGKGDAVLEFVGPREEGENGRWWDKLEARRWF